MCRRLTAGRCGLVVQLQKYTIKDENYDQNLHLT